VAEGERTLSARESNRAVDVGVIPRFALIIGAMKAGTSTLYELLTQHPEVCPCDVKEPDFFSYDFSPNDRRDYYKRWDFDTDAHRWALEASTSYTKYPRWTGTAERISGFPAEFRLIYLLRDPVDRIESQIAHNVARNRHGTLQEGEVHVGDHRIATSSYAMQLDRYRKAMPDIPILLLEMGDLETIEGTRNVTKRCADFLEIDASFTFERVPPRNVRIGGGRADEVVLSTEQREEIREALSDDVRRLRAEYGFDTSRWFGFD
jgi:Sulfotransferase domain